MFCVECGSTDKKMVGNICIDCFLKDFQMIEIPQRIEVQICSHCNSKLEEGKWSEENIPEEEIIYRALERNIKIADEVSNEIINLEIDQMKGTIANCYVEVIGEVEGTQIEETHDSEVKILKTVCPTCSKLQAGYYESVIQFRADKALKQDVADIYEQLGMDLPTAFRMFMKKSKQVRGLPFDAVLPETNTREDFRAAFNALREEASDVPEMTLEEINAEISAARADRKRG